MNLHPYRLTVAVLLATTAPLSDAAVPVFESDDFSIEFEGLLQADANWYDSDVADLDGDSSDGSDYDLGMRRSELAFKGKAPGAIDWVVGYDATGEKWLDVNLRRKLGAHTLQLGQFKQPNAMEELSSTRNNDFISKAMTTNTFGIARRLGVGYGYASGPWTATATWSGRELTSGGAHGAGYALRGTFAPVVGEGRIAHLGLSFVDRDTDADTLRLRTRPQADLAGVRLVDAGNLVDTDRFAILGLEGLWASGPFKLQGELMRSTVDRRDNADFTARGAYLSAVWNVTGESWSYKAGVPATPRPADAARGMWQLGLRYDTVDLDDAGVAGGRMDAVTAGVNWYWQENFKLMLNYVRVDSLRRGVSDDPRIVVTRAQFHW
jgi:phosphate-selective porin OprO and OprP